VKRHKVIVTPEAQAGILESFRFLHEDSPQNASHWLIDLYSKIDTLEHFPERCSYARESEFVDEDLRQLVFGSHRIVFSVDPATTTVYVLHVRHGKMRAVGEPEPQS
jgi:plasmid stabilization system protein ParE